MQASKCTEATEICLKPGFQCVFYALKRAKAVTWRSWQVLTGSHQLYPHFQQLLSWVWLRGTHMPQVSPEGGDKADMRWTNPSSTTCVLSS